MPRRSGTRVPYGPFTPDATLFSDGGPVSGIAGQLIDISEAGCGVLMDPSGGMFSIDKPITIRVSLPDDPATVLELNARVARVGPVPGGICLGVHFLFDPSNAFILQSRLARYAAQTNRRAA